MPRSTNAPASRNRRRKFLKKAKGYVGGRGSLYRTARETVQRAMVYATRDRKQRKREFRSLWTIRINAACRQFGTNYSRFIQALKLSHVELNRKSLAEIAVHDLEGFKQIVEMVSQAKP